MNNNETKETPWKLWSYQQCMVLLSNLVEYGYIQKDYNPRLGEGIYVYKTAGIISPEGWYFRPIEGAAYDLSISEYEQKELLNILRDLPVPLSTFGVGCYV